MKHTNSEELFIKLQRDVDAILHDFREHLKEDPKEELIEAHFNVDLVLQNTIEHSLNPSRIISSPFDHKHMPKSHAKETSETPVLVQPETHDYFSGRKKSKGPMKKINSAFDMLFKVVEY